MITDEQCAEFMRLPMPINDILREVFKAGFRAGDAAQDGASLNPFDFRAGY